MNHIKAQNTFASQNSTQFFWPKPFGNYQSFIAFFSISKASQNPRWKKETCIHRCNEICCVMYLRCIRKCSRDVKNMRISKQVRKVTKLVCRTVNYHQTLKFFLLFSGFEMKNTTNGQRPEGTMGQSTLSYGTGGCPDGTGYPVPWDRVRPKYARKLVMIVFFFFFEKVNLMKIFY